MIFEAGLITFFRTLLIFAGIYYAFKLIIRFLFPWILKRFLNKQFSAFDPQQNNNPQNSTQAERKASNDHSKKKDTLGEYVEYEEIKDENDLK